MRNGMSVPPLLRFQGEGPLGRTMLRIPVEPLPACLRIRVEQRGGKLITSTGAVVGRAPKYRVRIYECACGEKAERTLQSNGREKPGRVRCPACGEQLRG